MTTVKFLQPTILLIRKGTFPKKLIHSENFTVKSTKCLTL